MTQIPVPHVAYPRLETSLIPALESHFKVPRPDGAPTMLTIDWKTSRPEAVKQFKELLDAHAEWFSSAPKAADSPLTTRRLTVCFSGSEAAKDAYDALIPDGGIYRAFRDRVVSGRYEDDVAAYIPGNSTALSSFPCLSLGGDRARRTGLGWRMDPGGAGSPECAHGLGPSPGIPGSALQPQRPLGTSRR